MRNRVKEHFEGNVKSTEYRRPLKLIYFEGCTNREDAIRREKYLKTTQGRRFLGLRIKKYKFSNS